MPTIQRWYRLNFSHCSLNVFWFCCHEWSPIGCGMQSQMLFSPLHFLREQLQGLLFISWIHLLLSLWFQYSSHPVQDIHTIAHPDDVINALCIDIITA